MSAPSAVTRKAVYMRDGGVCVVCGTPDGLTFQHRRASGMGGAKNLPAPVDGLTACAPHNARFEGDMQARALASGWKVRRWADPSLVPVYYPTELQWFRLQGTKRIRIPEAVAVELMHLVYGRQWDEWAEEANR